MSTVDLFLEQYSRVCDEYRLTEREMDALWERLKTQAMDALGWRERHPQATAEEALAAIRAMTLRELAYVVARTTHGTPAERKRVVLITGGAGFIGSHVADRLLQHHHDTRVQLVRAGRTTRLSSIYGAVDGAVFNVSAERGVDLQTEMAWKQADEHRLPCMVVVQGWGKNTLMEAVRAFLERLVTRAIPLQLPLFKDGREMGILDVVQMQELHRGERREIRPQLHGFAMRYRNRLIETLGLPLWKKPDAGELKCAIRAATLSRAIVPLLCGPRDSDSHLQNIFDAVVDYLPSPCDAPPIRGLDFYGRQVERRADDKQPFAAYCFDYTGDDYLGGLAYCRVYSGSLQPKRAIFNATRHKAERGIRIVHISDVNRSEIEDARAGDVVVLAGLKNVYAGDVLCDPEERFGFGRIDLPQPLVGGAIKIDKIKNRERLLRQLWHYMREDPALDVDVGARSIKVHAAAEQDLERIAERLTAAFQVLIVVDETWVLTKKKVTRAVVFNLGAMVRVELEPRERAGVKIVRRSVQACATLDGLRRSLALYSMTDVFADIAHCACDVHNYRDIKQKVQEAFADAVATAQCAIVEPVMLLEIYSAVAGTKKILEDLERRDAEIQSIEKRPRANVVRALAPLRKLLGYRSRLKEIADGQSTCEMVLYEHRPRPPGGTHGT
jgi:elongation factor G